jgi:gluconolactonase
MNAVKPRHLAPAQGFPEGPCFDKAGNLFWVNCSSGQISKLSTDGELSCFLDTGAVPQAGNFASSGDMYVCEAGLHQIITVHPDASWEVLAEKCDGVPFRSPNDLVVDPFDNLYFTDPGGSKPDNPIGTVHFVSKGGEVTKLAEGMEFPNGIAMTADAHTLSVVETYPRCVWNYDIVEPGVVAEKRMLWQDEDEDSLPDGMAYDAEGNLWVAAFRTGTIAVVSPQGETLDRYDAGGLKPTNCVFGGPDLSTLYVTEVETNSIYTIETGVKGQKLFADMARTMPA